MLGVFGQHLETDEVGILVADHHTVHKDVVLLVHQLAESVDVERSTHADKKLGILHVAVKLVECFRLGAVRQVQVVELLQVFMALIVSPFLRK